MILCSAGEAWRRRRYDYRMMVRENTSAKLKKNQFQVQIPARWIASSMLARSKHVHPNLQNVRFKCSVLRGGFSFRSLNTPDRSAEH